MRCSVDGSGSDSDLSTFDVIVTDADLKQIKHSLYLGMMTRLQINICNGWSGKCLEKRYFFFLLMTVLNSKLPPLR